MKFPAQMEKGIEQFNRREFFDCHETLEDYWHKQTGPERELTQGIIQIAVGYYHLLRNNGVGAAKLFQRGLLRIAPFRPQYCGLDLDDLFNSVEHSLEIAKATDFQAADTIHIPQIRYHIPD